jgi:aminotransferase
MSHDHLGRPSRRAAHLANDNPLRALTEVISRVPGGINLGQGVCDLETPAPLVEGAVESIRGADRQTYTHYSGLPDLKRAIRAKLARDNGLKVDEDEVMVASGSSGAMYAAALALLDPGDEVVLFEPFYSYHYSTLKLLGLVPVPVPLGRDDLALDVAALRAGIGARTRAMIVNTPANPSGKVFTRTELESIASLLADTGVSVFTDEVYEYLCYDGREHVSPATIEGLANRTITIGSFSKTFSITGWRIGYLAGPRAAVELAGRVFDQIAVCAARPLQRGVARGLDDLETSFYVRLREAYERKRDRFCEALGRAGFDVAPPQGAYYVLAGYRDVLGDVNPYDAAMTLIERAGINSVPGDVFYARPDGVRSIRFHFAVDDEVLDSVCARLESLS